MPAIDLSKLRLQVRELVNHTSNPEIFLKNLQDLLEYYRNYSLKVEQKFFGSIFSRYQTPEQVLRTIKKELGKAVTKKPDTGLELATILWNEPFFETKYLAVSLLRSIPPNSAIEIISRIPEIAENITEREKFLPELLIALNHIREEKPGQIFNVISSWLTDKDTRTQSWGLEIISRLVSRPDDENLPTVFKLLNSILLTQDPATQTELVQCIKSLYYISPSETTHFLVESIKEIKNEKTLEILSKSARRFPESLYRQIKPLLIVR
ncbi:DNA alkylation repair protein [Chloroflexota bacterium]